MPRNYDVKSIRAKQKEARRLAKDPFAWLQADISACQYKRDEAQSIYRFQSERLVKLKQRLYDLQVAAGAEPEIEFGQAPGQPGGQDQVKVKMT